jgi:hypothetical protein
MDMGGWIGGQAEYVMVPYADFNHSESPSHAEKILDLTMQLIFQPVFTERLWQCEGWFSRIYRSSA